MVNILVVDDSPIDRQLFEGLLSKEPEFTIIQAADGKTALEKIREWGINLVITDLQMPVMDGLELVKAIRSDFPDIPTILTTGFGSEEIANAALTAGAASYVPKSKAATLLLPTVRGVLEMLVTDRNYAELLSRATEARFEFELDNNEKYFGPICDLCNRMLTGLSPLGRIERLRVLVAIEHALKNALYRGNLEIESSYLFPEGEHPLSDELSRLVTERQKQLAPRQLHVCFAVSPVELRCTIQDEGAGFSPDENSGEMFAGGRGLILMRAFMDEVQFNGRGNSVELIRHWGGSSTAATETDESEEDLLLVPEDASPLGQLSCEDPPLTYKLHESAVLVGSQRSCHVVLPHPGIAAHHCQLSFDDRTWTFRAFPSEIGVTHNGRTAPSGELRSGDKIGFGKVVFTIRY